MTKLLVRFKNLRKISKQDVLNFVVTHPRLVTVMAGIGISFTFASVGRFFVHEAFALASSSYAVDSLAYNVPADHITSIEIDKVARPEIHHVAISVFCDGCAAPFAPGQEAISPGDAKDFAPGELDKSPGDAQNIAPGHIFKKEIP
jgi:hypothetical protein